MAFIDKIADVVNDQKGELMALECLVISILRALPRDMQSRVLAEFDRETVIGRGLLRHSDTPAQVAEGFDRYVEHLNRLRKPPEPRETI